MNEQIVPADVVELAIHKKHGKRGHLKYLQDELGISSQQAKNVWSQIENGIAQPVITSEELGDVGISYRELHEIKNNENACYEAASKLTQAKFKHLTDELTERPVNENDESVETDDESQITYTDKYVYNERSETYVVFLKSVGKQVIVPKHKHEAMQQAYSNWNGDPQSINEVCMAFKMTRASFEEYKRLFNWTHDMLPVTDERLVSDDEQAIVDDLLQSKRFTISQKFAKEDWKETQADALKWKRFQALSLDPFEHILSKFQPKPLEQINFTDLGDADSKIDPKTFLIGLSDLHFGAKADPEELTKGVTFNLEKAATYVRRYADMIAKDVATRKYDFDKAIVAVIGDILHSLDGETKRGTELDFDKIGEEQFDVALQSLIQFISHMLEIFPEVQVECVKGNHAGIDEYMLYKAIASFFANNPRAKFNVHRARTAFFKVENTLVILDHGDSDSARGGSVPSAGDKRDGFIQSLLLQHVDLLQGVKNKIFIQGHLHHFSYDTNSDYDFVMFGSFLGTDKHSDHLGYRSRPQQQCLVLDESGTKEVLNYFFD